MRNHFVHLFVFVFGTMGCVTSNTPKPISQEEYSTEREARLERIENFLVKSQEVIFDDRTRFDSCFSQIPDKDLRAAIVLEGPKSHKFNVEQISPPTGLKDEDEFRRCLRVEFNRLDMPIDNETSAKLLAVIFPSKAEPSTTKIHPMEYQIPPNRICLGLQRQFYKLKTWDLRKRKDGFISENHRRFASENHFICSGENLRGKFPWDLSEVRKKFPNEDLEGYFVADGFE